ncbi:hypothetical protein IAQ61_010242, partial [Plenodomus lingam]|uniref:uncharacterized protein n=1 Tax=Leptosphaeria maculans TaxID=5022 RepID=UPI00331C8526
MYNPSKSISPCPNRDRQRSPIRRHSQHANLWMRIVALLDFEATQPISEAEWTRLWLAHAQDRPGDWIKARETMGYRIQ